MKWGLWIILIVLCAPMVLSASIQGYVYDLSLDEVSEVVVTISTTPHQRFVVKDQGYSFTVTPGTYNISALMQVDDTIYTAEEEVIVVADGDFNVDLILFPSSTGEESLFDQDINVDEDVAIPEVVHPSTPTSARIVIFILALCLICALVYMFLRKNKQETIEDDLSAQVVAFLKKEQGRATQKEIRKHFPVSEAKISLVITELESKGKVEKIKKGKSNVVVLR